MQKLALRAGAAIVTIGAILYAAYAINSGSSKNVAQETVAPQTTAVESADEKTPTATSTDTASNEAPVNRAPAVLPTESALPKPRPPRQARRATPAVKPVAPPVIESSDAGEEPAELATPVTPAATAVAPLTGTETLEIAKAIEKDGRGFSATLEAGHLLGVEKDVRTFTQFLGEVRYRINRHHQVGIGQEAKKLYLIAPAGEKEFLLGDTVVMYEGALSDDFLSMQWKLNASTTLPVSRRSQDVKHVTRPMVGLDISKRLFERLTISYRPAFTYYFNQFATDPSGVPLRKMAIAQMAEAKLDLWRERLSLVLWGQGFINFSEQYDFVPTTPAPGTSYQYGSYLGFQAIRNVGIQVGYVRGNSLISDFRYEDNFYDAPTSRYYAALRVDF
jgi:hypothetical protein